MQNLNYNQIQKIEMNATKKLLNYISKETEFEDTLENIEFFYPDFGETKNRIAFNIWISIDFMGEDGKTFIEKFLEEKSKKLTSAEKEILIERNKSNISLFEIIDVEDEFIFLMDLLQNEEHKIWEPELSSMVHPQDIIFGRIGKLLGHLTFIGDINYLPVSTKSIFLEEIFFDFNHLRLEFPNLTMKEYLKKHSINLYKIYTNCMFEAMEMDEDITSTLYDELDEFEAYLHLKTSSPLITKHIGNLIDFFEYYLEDYDLTLYDLDKINLYSFFTEAIQDGFISSHENLNSYISTLKSYLVFLSNMNNEYKEVYKEILNISKSRFDLMKQFASVKAPFKINRNFLSYIYNQLNDDVMSLLMDYDKFILYVLDRPLDLTINNKHIKRKNLLEINNILENTEHLNKKTPNQKDFPLIHMFFNISIHLGLFIIDGNTLTVAKKGSNYLRLRDEEKYTLFFQYIWSNEFIANISESNNKSVIEKFKKELIDLLSSFTPGINYGISLILPTFSTRPEFFFKYHKYLEYLGFLQCSLYPNYEIKVAPLGRLILEFLKSQDETTTKCSVIHLESFRKSR